ncbi:hypothetical protein BD414DRAFT_474003 [Trametes punicea]|nr:hypothetical protein BD414DRAFT_474003 [Trametes punicea]
MHSSSHGSLLRPWYSARVKTTSMGWQSTHPIGRSDHCGQQARLKGGGETDGQTDGVMDAVRGDGRTCAMYIMYYRVCSRCDGTRIIHRDISHQEMLKCPRERDLQGLPAGLTPASLEAGERAPQHRTQSAWAARDRAEDREGPGRGRIRGGRCKTTRGCRCQTAGRRNGLDKSGKKERTLMGRGGDTRRRAWWHWGQWLCGAEARRG